MGLDGLAHCHTHRAFGVGTKGLPAPAASCLSRTLLRGHLYVKGEYAAVVPDEAVEGARHNPPASAAFGSPRRADFPAQAGCPVVALQVLGPGLVQHWCGVG